jgi:hypothetical protein
LDFGRLVSKFQFQSSVDLSTVNFLCLADPSATSRAGRAAARPIRALLAFEERSPSRPTLESQLPCHPQQVRLNSILGKTANAVIGRCGAAFGSASIPRGALQSAFGEGPERDSI